MAPFFARHFALAFTYDFTSEKGYEDLVVQKKLKCIITHLERKRLIFFKFDQEDRMLVHCIYLEVELSNNMRKKHQNPHNQPL